MPFAFNRTREQLSRLVLRKLGVMGSSQTDVSADMEIVYEAADLRLKEMHANGILWRNVVTRPFSFSVTANTASASATADVLFPIKMMIVDGSLDEPVEIISRREYAAIPDKAETGLPVKVVHDGGAQFVFWPVPTASTNAKMLYEAIADDTSAGSSLDLDVAMLRSLANILAYDCADHFGINEQKMARLQRDAMIGERRIRALNAEHVDITDVVVDGYDDFGTTRTRHDWHTG